MKLLIHLKINEMYYLINNITRHKLYLTYLLLNKEGYLVSLSIINKWSRSEVYQKKTREITPNHALSLSILIYLYPTHTTIYTHICNSSHNTSQNKYQIMTQIRNK